MFTFTPTVNVNIKQLNLQTIETKEVCRFNKQFFDVFTFTVGVNAVNAVNKKVSSAKMEKNDERRFQKNDRQAATRDGVFTKFAVGRSNAVG